MKLILVILSLFSVIAQSAIIVNNKLVSNTMSVEVGKSLRFQDLTSQKYADLHFFNLFEKNGHYLSLDNIKSFSRKDVTPNYVSTSVFQRDEYFTLETTHMMFSADMDYTNEKNQTMLYRNGEFRSSLLMTNWDFGSQSTNLFLQFSLQGSVTDVRQTVVHMENFRIEFDPYCVADGQAAEVKLHTDGKYYYLEFPSFVDELFYEFSVTLNSTDRVYRCGQIVRFFVVGAISVFAILFTFTM